MSSWFLCHLTFDLQIKYGGAQVGVGYYLSTVAQMTRRPELGPLPCAAGQWALRVWGEDYA